MCGVAGRDMYTASITTETRCFVPFVLRSVVLELQARILDKCIELAPSYLDISGVKRTHTYVIYMYIKVLRMSRYDLDMSEVNITPVFIPFSHVKF